MHIIANPQQRMAKGNKKSKINARRRIESEVHAKEKGHTPANDEIAVPNNPVWVPQAMPVSSLAAISFNGVSYQGIETRTKALYYVSHAHNPTQAFPPAKMSYVHPNETNIAVIVYVIEKSYSDEDVSSPQECWLS